MSKRLQILVVDDDPNDAQLLVRELQRAELEFEWLRVDTEADFTAHLHSGVDLIYFGLRYAPIQRSSRAGVVEATNRP